MTPSRVTVIIEYQAQPDQLATAIAEIERLIATVVTSEADCFGIRLLQDSAAPTRLLLYEQWASEKAYLGPHFETAHIQDFIARAGGFMTGAPEIRFWLERSEHLPGGVSPIGGGD